MARMRRLVSVLLGAAVLSAASISIPMLASTSGAADGTGASPSDSASASPSASAMESCTSTDTRLVNGDFERPLAPPKYYKQFPDADVPGWTTTASDHKIEIWSNGFGGVSAPEGTQFAEINATQAAELYQVVDTVPGQTLVWSLAHRARGAGAAGDTMSVNIGPESGDSNSRTTFDDALSAGWVRHTGTYVVPDGQTRTRFGFESGPTASGNKSIGNFLDDIFFTTTTCWAAEERAPMPEVSEAPSLSPTPTASASATESPTASATQSASATPRATATASATARPTSGETPVVVAPDGPTVIPADELPPGVVDVVPPQGGSAELKKDGSLTITPRPGTVLQEVTLFVRQADGMIATRPLQIRVGLAPRPCMTLPASLAAGVTVLPAVNGACQPAKATVTCSPLTRGKVTGDVSFCRTWTSGGRTYVRIAAMPLRVEVGITAKATSTRPAVDISKAYLVR